MELRDIIRSYRAEHHLSQREFAAKCQNISHAYLAIIESDVNPSTGKKSEPSMDKLASLASGMGITLSKLLQMMGRAPEDPQQLPVNAIPYVPARAMVPIVGSVRCGAGGLAYEDLQGAELADVANPEEYFYLRAEGDSMSPNIMAGDLVLVHIQPDVESGELAVVIIDGEEGTLKKLIKKDNAIILQAFNQAHPPRVFVGEEMIQIKIAGRVMEVRRKF